MRDFVCCSSSKIRRDERSASIVQDLIEHEYVSGYLKKWSPVIGRGWQYRYFALLEQDRTLVYWAKKPTYRDEQPRGSINLKIVENVFADGPLGITLSTPHRDYQLKASTPTEKDKWMDSIILWTLKSRKYRSKTEDTKNYRFSNMLVEATQSCLNYIVESFLKPYKKSATRALEVGPETLSNSNKKKFLKDRGLYNVIHKAWVISQEIKQGRKNPMRRMRNNAEVKSMRIFSIEESFSEKQEINPIINEHIYLDKKSEFKNNDDFDDISLNTSNLRLNNSQILHKNSIIDEVEVADSEIFNSIREIEDVIMGCEAEEIMVPISSTYCIYDDNCPLTIEQEEEYTKFKQHKYSLQLSDLMLKQLSNPSKDIFLDNCIFGLVYIMRNNPIVPSLRSIDIFWGLMISSRSLIEAHYTYPSPILGEKTILGDCFEHYREIKYWNSNPNDICSNLNPFNVKNDELKTKTSNRRDSIPILNVIPNSQRSRSSLDVLNSNEDNNRNVGKNLNHGNSINTTLLPSIRNNLLNSLMPFNLNFNIKNGHLYSNNQPIDPYGFLLDTLYLYYPKNESKNPVHILDPKDILSIGPIMESLHGFCFTISFIGSTAIEDSIASDLEYMSDFPSSLPFVGNNTKNSTVNTNSELKQPISIQLCTRSWRDARAWRYSLLVARKSKLIDLSYQNSNNESKCKVICGKNKQFSTENITKINKSNCLDSCPTLTTTASSSARTSNGHHLLNYRRNIPNLGFNK